MSGSRGEARGRDRARVLRRGFRAEIREDRGLPACGHFVEERLADAAVCVARPERGASPCEASRGMAEVWSRSLALGLTGIRDASISAPASDLLSFAEGDEVLAPGDDFAVAVEAGLEPVIAAGTIGVVSDVVFARPKKLDGHTGLFREPCSFDHVVVHEPPAEATAGADQMHSYRVVGDANGVSGKGATFAGGLTRRPHLQFAVFEGRGGAHGF